MAHALNETVSTLRDARERKGLSQRDLNQLSGVPQGQISKIENGAVDLRLSSLVELARALELELVLVPRKALPAVKAIIRSTESPVERQPQRERREWDKVRNLTSSLLASKPDAQEYKQLQRYLTEIQHMHASLSSDNTVDDLQRTLRQLSSHEGEEPRRRVLEAVKALRNKLAHADHAPQREVSQRPAYSLDEDEDDNA